MEKIHERSLKFLSNDYLSSYAELLEKSTSVSMETKRLRTMVYEIFKTLNNLNPVFMKDIFHYSPNVTRKKHNLYIHTQNTTKFGNKSLRAFGANIWNTLPEYIKSTTSLLEFKKIIKTWPNVARTKIQMKRLQMRMKFPLKYDTRYAQQFAKVNSEPWQAS